MEIKNCSWCKNDFEYKKPKRGGRNSRAKNFFCSKRCNGTFWSMAAWEKQRIEIHKPKKCTICETEYVPRNRNQSSCSQKCNAVIQRDVARAESALRRPRSGVCRSSYCGKEFVPKDGVWAVQKYCSARCYRREVTRRFRTKHPDRVRAYQRRSKWGGNWLKAMERDKVCQKCGTSEKLIVHHLDGEGETRSKNHALDNLQVLCLSCHGSVHHDFCPIFKNGELFVRMGDVLYRCVKV